MCDSQLPNEPEPTPAEKRWRIEALLQLGGGLMLGFSLFTLASIWLHQDLSGTDEGQLSPPSLLFSTVSLQVLVLVLVHFFLRQHEVSWGEFIGIGSGRWRKAAWQGLLIGWGALPPA